MIWPKAVELTLSMNAGAAVAAGESVLGQVTGDDGTAVVGLLRVERSPAGVYSFEMASSRVEVLGGTGSFELHAPAWLPPEATAPRCRLHYVVRLGWRPSRWSRKEMSRPVAILPAEQTVHESRNRIDRLIPSQPGRGFHLELVDAALEGGGHLAGRIHRDAGNADREFVVTAHCDEVWCTNFRFRSRRSPLLWETERLWSATEPVLLDADDHWGPFRFEIPEGLPAATEGRVIAWRYTLEGRAAARRAFAGHAVLTPIWFEI